MKSCIYIYIYVRVLWNILKDVVNGKPCWCIMRSTDSGKLFAARGKREKGERADTFIVITSVFSSPLLHHYSCSQTQSCWTGISSRLKLLLLKKLYKKKNKIIRTKLISNNGNEKKNE